MVQLTRLLPGREAQLFAKLEAFNPGGSVKDRIGVAMIEAAEREGRIEPGRTTIVEATSGNTGIALAFVCAAKGYELVLTLPQGMSRERERLLALYGARFEITESLGGMNEAVDAARSDGDARRRVPARPVLQPGQPGGSPPHAPGPRLWEALDGKVDVFVAGVGTGGTITGVGEYLKERNPRALVAVEPASSPVLSGGRPGPHRIQGIGAGFVPTVLNREVSTRCSRSPTTTRSATAQRLRRARGGARGHLRRAPLSPARSRWPRAPEFAARGSP